MRIEQLMSFLWRETERLRISFQVNLFTKGFTQGGIVKEVLVSRFRYHLTPGFESFEVKQLPH